MRLFTSYGELEGLAAPVYLTVGFFDGVHRGHQHLLSRLNAAADAEMSEPLVITFRNSPKNYHRQPLGDRRPRWRYLNTWEEKLDLLDEAGTRNVLLLDYGQETSEQTALQFLLCLKSHCHLAGFCAGYDTSIGKDMLSGREGFFRLTEELGIRLEFVEPFSFLLEVENGQPVCVLVKSSLVRDLIAAGDLQGAEAILGHPYLVSGQVVPGKGLGGPRLGIHTANLHIPPEKITPPTGIYAGWADVASELHPAAIALAEPKRAFSTVLDRQHPQTPSLQPDSGWMVAEAHLIGFEGNLYGERIRLSFVKRLRGWEDFSSAEELEAQMRGDIENARRACLARGDVNEANL